MLSLRKLVTRPALWAVMLRWNSNPAPSHQPTTTQALQPTPLMEDANGGITVTYTPGSGPGGALAAPTTVLTDHCNTLSECVTKADELAMQMKAQAAAGDEAAQILTKEAMEEFVTELRTTAQTEVNALVSSMTQPGMIQRAGMHELRRSLFYAGNLKQRDWIDTPRYTTMMRSLTVEFLRRDNFGVLSPDDVLYISTHIVVADFYNRHLWNRLERSMTKPFMFENIDIGAIKGLTTRLFRTRKGCPRETMDMRRKILNAMARRVGTLANDFDLPSLLGVLQCYTVHETFPKMLESLAQRAINHIADYTPQECATMSQILRRWGLLRIEVCEKLVERILTSEELSHGMALSAFQAVKSCFSWISDGGRNAMNAEPMRQKLRAMSEQVGCRLDEVTYPVLAIILQILDAIVLMKVYVPKKCLQSMFTQSNSLIESNLHPKQETEDPSKPPPRPITVEEARQLQALLMHYGTELCTELHAKLKEAFRAGLFPDEASVF